MNWFTLESISDLERIVSANAADKSIIAIFKHSTRCSISSMAKYRLENSWEKVNPSIPIYLLDLISHRDVSNEIASKFEIAHQSPQLILLKEGKAVYDASHISISSKAVSKHI